MHRPLLLAALCALIACQSEQPVSPITKNAPISGARSTLDSGEPFFVAWSATYVDGPVRTQPWSGVDSRQYRQYTGGTADAGLLAFAAANPGKLYIAGDEPDQACTSAYDYAGTYHDFVAAVRGADPTARFSPAGFGDPNSNCCPPGSEHIPCWDQMHSTGYAQQLYDSYYARYSVLIPVDEWRFHNWGNWLNGEINTWYSQVNDLAAWSVNHGANMTLGSWGFLGWTQPTAAFQVKMQEAMDLLRTDSRINQAAWWSYENTGFSHYLANPDGSLTPEGQTYVNATPTVIPSGVTLVGSSGGHAKLRWTSTSYARVEAEFWVQPVGSNTFSYYSTELVAVGGTETPVDAFTMGDRVKGRARYYNFSGPGAWSAFSNVVLMH